MDSAPRDRGERGSAAHRMVSRARFARPLTRRARAGARSASRRSRASLSGHRVVEPAAPFHSVLWHELAISPGTGDGPSQSRAAFSARCPSMGGATRRSAPALAPSAGCRWSHEHYMNHRNNPTDDRSGNAFDPQEHPGNSNDPPGDETHSTESSSFGAGLHSPPDQPAARTTRSRRGGRRKRGRGRGPNAGAGSVAGPEQPSAGRRSATLATENGPPPAERSGDDELPV